MKIATITPYGNSRLSFNQKPRFSGAQYWSRIMLPEVATKYDNICRKEGIQVGKTTLTPKEGNPELREIPVTVNLITQADLQGEQFSIKDNWFFYVLKWDRNPVGYVMIDDEKKEPISMESLYSQYQVGEALTQLCVEYAKREEMNSLEISAKPMCRDSYPHKFHYRMGYRVCKPFKDKEAKAWSVEEANRYLGQENADISQWGQIRMRLEGDLYEERLQKVVENPILSL